MTTATLEAPPAIDPLDHQGLVYAIALSYRGRGVEVADLAQEGQFGLLRAIEMFDPGRDTKFSTYASYWIKNYIRAALLDQSGIARLPKYQHQAIRDGKTPDSPGLSPKGRQALAAAIRLRAAQVAGSCDLAAHRMDLADLATERVSDLPDEEDLHEVLRAIVTLPVPLRRVIRLRYGLYGHEPMTQREAAARIGLTRQRVHQLEHEAIKELRQRLGGAA